MSAFNGVIAIRRYCSQFPNLAMTDVVLALRRVSPDDAYHDYTAALSILSLAPCEQIDHANIPELLRETLSTLIENRQPWWLRLAPIGRDRVRSALSTNEMQCFEAAGLFVEMPSSEVRLWWDRLSQAVRATADSKRLEQGRVAEQLTVEYETHRLTALGISNRPRWISIDDNTVGYDVQSYDPGSVEPVAKLIEVKSCARDASEIYLTRNEWETAVERAPHYWFHVWLLPENRLIELTPRDISRHVPEDRGDGRWENTKIALGIL